MADVVHNDGGGVHHADQVRGEVTPWGKISWSDSCSLTMGQAESQVCETKLSHERTKKT
jgi:hypothetical protein